MRSWIGRITSLALVVMMQNVRVTSPEGQRNPSHSPAKAIGWPNLRILKMGDAQLGRRGTLIDATGALYRRHLASHPINRNPQMGRNGHHIGRLV